ncbi:MAG: hypothetical protein Q8911_10120 [Bacillota bacterium]|nr:hypothetical protein [Bacillota bacterium]
MLGKLLKYELKATGRILLPLFLALLLFAGINRFLTPLGPKNFDTPAMISMTIYIMIMVGMFVMTFMMMIQRFYRNLLSDEGYLMHTLPVKPWQQIVSKLLVSMLWIVGSGIVAFISILIIAVRNADFTMIVSQVATIHNRVFEQLGTRMYFLSLEMILGFLLSLASGILVVYASIAVGHLVNRHKMLTTFGAFIVLTSISKFLLTLISLTPLAHLSNINISSPHDLIAMQPLIQWGIVYGTIFTGLLCVVYFAVTSYILSKRLNLE